MTADDIRAEAVERIAKELFAMRRRSSDPEWGDPRPGFAWKWRLHRESAARLVDALGDLLPTDEEFAIGSENYRLRAGDDEAGARAGLTQMRAKGARAVRLWHHWKHSWTEVAE
jgi:hypothetical protein